MNKQLIQWPRAQYWDKPWNPIIGCRKCSPACEHCYAESMMRRFGAADFSPRLTIRTNPPGSGVVFCGNMTDIFGEWNDDSTIVELICRCLKNKTTPYLWLTKRVDRMCRATSALCPNMTNHYFGFTAENQEWYSDRYSTWMLLAPAWPNWWISAEPLLGPIDLDLWNRPITGAFGVIPHLPSWVVVGCESGPSRRPCKIEWVESIVDQCRAANVPVFVKQLDLNGKCECDIMKFPKHLQIRQVPWAKEGNIK